jgi:hypothetical protein
MCAVCAKWCSFSRRSAAWPATASARSHALLDHFFATCRAHEQLEGPSPRQRKCAWDQPMQLVAADRSILAEFNAWGPCCRQACYVAMLSSEKACPTCRQPTDESRLARCVYNPIAPDRPPLCFALTLRVMHRNGPLENLVGMQRMRCPHSTHDGALVTPLKDNFRVHPPFPLVDTDRTHRKEYTEAHGAIRAKLECDSWTTADGQHDRAEAPAKRTRCPPSPRTSWHSVRLALMPRDPALCSRTEGGWTADGAASGAGCPWVGTILEFRAHYAACLWAPVACPNAATGCERIISRRELEEHQRTCTFVSVRCPNEGCDAVIPRPKLYQHRAQCVREKVAPQLPSAGIIIIIIIIIIIFMITS